MPSQNVAISIKAVHINPKGKKQMPRIIAKMTIRGDESIEIDTDLSAIGCTGVAVGIALVATEEVLG